MLAACRNDSYALAASLLPSSLYPKTVQLHAVWGKSFCMSWEMYSLKGTNGDSRSSCKYQQDSGCEEETECPKQGPKASGACDEVGVAHPLALVSHSNRPSLKW